MKNQTFVICTLMLTACGGESSPVPPHDETRYRAVAADGTVMESPVDSWDCVLDRYTGLTWEAKTDEPGLHHWSNTYSWYDPDESLGELDYRGTPDAGQCQRSACDTHAWVEAVNQVGRCGYTDWRVAGRDELASISDATRADNPPTANTRFFPHMQAEEYWSSNDYSFQWDAAWVWSYRYGHDRVEWKASPRHARLVRGEAQRVERVKD